jgi:hypothetical protein
MKRNWLILVTVLVIVGRVSAAGAITYTLAVENAGAIQEFTQPFGQVTVTLTSATTADFLFTTLAPSPLSVPNDTANAQPSYTFINNNMAAVNINAAVSGDGKITVSNFLAKDQAGNILANTFSKGPKNYQLNIGGNNGGALGEFGIFNLAIDGPNNTHADTDQIFFTVTRNDGGSWTTDADVTTFTALPNGTLTKFVVEGHLNPDWGAATGNTFYAVNHAPLPSTILLMGSGLAGLALLRRKWSLKK